ncbi:ead/Ea22-like family protein [Escherichia coli]|nr:ead/Ea22-like family protein [Escherichia coli]
MHDDWGFDADLFHELVTPSIVLELLDERERNQQYIKSRGQENEEIALTVGKLRVELEAAKSKLNEQREYYDGVIADGGKRIAELEKQCAEWERKALSNFEECAAIADTTTLKTHLESVVKTSLSKLIKNAKATKKANLFIHI